MAENNKKDSFNFPPVGGKNNKGPKFGGYWSFIIIAAFIIGIQFFSMPSNPERISWQKFKTDLLAKGEVKDIYIVRNGGKAEITLKPEKVETHSDLVAKGFNQKSVGPQYYVPFGTLEQFEKNLQDAQKEFPEEASNVFIDYKDDFNWWGEVITLFLPIAIFVGIWIFFMRRMSKGAGGGGGGGGIFNVGKSKAKLFDKESNIKITFKDVAGLAEAKQEVEEIVSFLKSPDKYTKLGGKIPKGALLVGPPGTGKTLMAKAVAGEAGVPFFSISGSDFVEMFVGVGASRVRDLFEQAKKHQPCIVFIDEIDAVGRQRGAGLGGGHDEREQTLNQLLVEMDGFDENTNIIILAATNRPDILDNALLRPGRFDRQIVINKPDVLGREQILNVHAKNKPLSKEVDLKTLAKRTPGFTGADLQNLLNEAALLAARHDKSEIEMPDLEEAIDKVMAGPEKKSRIISDEEKENTAYHEVGHALLAKLLKNCDPLHKVSIIPRGMALGITLTLPEKDHLTMRKNQLLDRIAMILGGRVAEELIYGKDNVTTGASNDLEKVSNLARSMVTTYGMSEKMGNLAYGKDQEHVFMGRNFGNTRDFSEEIAADIDKEVKKIVDKQYDYAMQLLSENRDMLEHIAKNLLEKETLDEKEFEDLMNEVKNKRQVG